MLCNKCGETLQEGEKFCPNCGAKNDNTEDRSEFASEPRNASSDSCPTPVDSREKEAEMRHQEQKSSDFDSAYRTDRQRSSGGVDDFIHQVSDKINSWMDPVIRTFVNMKHGIWAVWGIAVLFHAITDQIQYSGSLLGKVFLSMITVSIVFGIEIFLVQFISRSIHFEYGFSKNTSSERNLLIMLAVAVINLISMLGIFLRLNRLHLGLVGAIMIAVIFAFILESMFYQYFTGDQAVAFIKRYLIVQLIFAIVKFILITIVVGLLFATIFGWLGGATYGIHEMTELFQMFQ